MKGSVFSAPLEQLKHVKSEEGQILTKPFLDVCKTLLPVLDKFGAALSIVKSDVGGNISRLESKYQSNPSEYKHLHSLVQKEVEAKTAKSSSSCTNGLLWLTRSMDFLVLLFGNLQAHQNWTMEQVAMKLAPERKKFLETISSPGDDFESDIGKFCTNFSSVLQENHNFLASVGMDNLKA
ncbi:hypothetical protein L6164_009965 [Bauhinia variegata]|uniref:Uncharacterized protein n=1 Tax=Bauhinia variegata TaxID=167791 RepID=A0ACB9PLT7_BAUVA|nr:hypothetical protein L6164_009965 [Bauhinia variegata]